MVAVVPVLVVVVTVGVNAITPFSKSSIFVLQKATAPKSGVEFCQGSIGTIRVGLATSYDVWRRRARQNYDGVGWSGGRVGVPGTFYSHFVVQLANLQDFQHS